MLKTLKLENFTAFAKAECRFAPGLNVIVGENGTGKTHLLKAAYVYTHIRGKNRAKEENNRSYMRFWTAWQDKIMAVFKPHKFDDLTRAGSNDSAFHYMLFEGCSHGIRIKNSPSKGSKLRHFARDLGCEADVFSGKCGIAVYFPTRELITLCPEFVSLYESTYVPFEETWRDTCLLLGRGLSKKPQKSLHVVIKAIEKAVGGSLEVDTRHFFFLSKNGQHRLEAHLVAEGRCKLAMLARLIVNGSLEEGGMLFWDEPETNLNSKLLKELARVMLNLCKAGIQVFVTTHNLFLMREFDILLSGRGFKKVKARFFGLHPGKDGVEIQQGESVDDIGRIDALDEELMQSDRYLKISTK